MNVAVQRWRRVLLLALVVAGLLWSGWRWVKVRGYRTAMAGVQEEVENGRYGTAARKLVALLARNPNSDEAHYLLGTCEMARGRTQEAEAAWARVKPGSPFAPSAILGSMQIQLEVGRLAEAERIIRDALDNPGIDGSSLPILLGPIYCQQGRLEETLRLIETRWDALYRAGQGASEPAINLIRAHVDLRRSPIPIDVTRSVLDEAARRAPDDDRVWLGKANLAIRMGSYDEAARWLDLCLKRRPDDASVWRSRLEWAVRSNRVNEAHEAVRRLPADDRAPGQLYKLSAWIARTRGDLESEERALERYKNCDAIDFEAMDRLVELAKEQGRADRIADLQHTRAEIKRMEARYCNLFERNQPQRDAAEMGQLAKRLGRVFEARAYLTVAVHVDPDRVDLMRSLAMLQERAENRQLSGRTLADLLAAELGEIVETSARLTPRPGYP
jgi:enediyne biosynthesis protein E4